MTVQVITVFAPRGPESGWSGYLPLLKIQRETAIRFGHGHLVVTDADLGTDLEQMRVELDAGLMRSMIVGVIKRLEASPAVGDLGGLWAHLVFLDVDCLVNRPLDHVFDGAFDMLLTRRDDNGCPINNGAMYVDAVGAANALRFFREALKLCGEHWGADQEAISMAASPVPGEDGAEERRHGCMIRFASMLPYAGVPKSPMKEMRRSNPYVIHFKGKEAKEWMPQYARSFILN